MTLGPPLSAPSPRVLTVLVTLGTAETSPHSTLGGSAPHRTADSTEVWDVSRVSSPPISSCSFKLLIPGGDCPLELFFLGSALAVWGGQFDMYLFPWKQSGSADSMEGS